MIIFNNLWLYIFTGCLKIAKDLSIYANGWLFMCIYTNGWLYMCMYAYIY